MHKMEELKDMLCDELDKVTAKGELSAGALDVVDKLTHSIKSIDTIMAMEEANYSHGDGYSYARRRDAMGRYSRNYSRDMADLKEHLKDLERKMTDEESKRMIKEWMREI